MEEGKKKEKKTILTSFHKTHNPFLMRGFSVLARYSPQICPLAPNDNCFRMFAAVLGVIVWQRWPEMYELYLLLTSQRL